MAATTATPLIEERVKDSDLLALEVAEKERLLVSNEVLILPPLLGQLGDSSPSLTVKTSKKVKLPDDETAAAAAGKFTIGPAPEDDWEMVPPDGRWGWCILVGATLVNILIPGSIKSFGVLFVEFMEVFEAGPTSASAIPALCYFLYSSLGPLSSILSVKWSYKTVTLIGGSFAAFGMIFSSWASSIGYLYISYGVMVGTGAGLAFPPTVYIVTSYFVRLRGLANGICMSGSAFGSIILPPLLGYLLNSYGYRGAVLIMGGIILNVWAAALLFQPVEEHLIRKYKEKDEEEELPQLETFNEEDMTLETYDSDPSGNIQRNATNVSMENGDSAQPKVLVTSEDSTPTGDKFPNGSPPTYKNQSALPGDQMYPKNNQNFVRSVSAAQVQNYKLDSDRKRKVSMPATSKNAGIPQIGSRPILSSANSTSRTHVKSSASLALESVPEGRSKMGSSEAFGRKLGVPKTPKRSPSTSSFQYMSTPFHGSTLSAFQQPNEFASQFSLKSVTESLAPITYCCGCRKKPKPKEGEVKEPNKYFDVTLLKDPTYLVILISNCTNAISYTNFIILLPSYALSLNFEKALGGYLLSIVSALDLVGRIGGSALSDTDILPKSWYFVGGLLVSGVSLACIPIYNTYMYISACCAVFGLASGIYVGVTALIMAEKLGTERLTSTYGISLFFNGILQLIGPPICGIWFERTGEYGSLFYTLGFILLIGASLWGFMPFINKRKRLKAEQERLKNAKV